MEPWERKIKTAVEKLAGTFKKDEIRFIWAQVVDYDVNAQTCIVMGENDVQIPNVALSAGVCDGMVKYPTKGSQVVIAETLNSPMRWVALYSDIDMMQITAQTGNGEIQFNDGSYGGIAKVYDPDSSNNSLLTQINRLESVVTDLISKFNKHTHSYLPGTGGATQSEAPFTTYQENRTLSPATKQSDIENPLITHGQ